MSTYIDIATSRYKAIDIGIDIDIYMTILRCMHVCVETEIISTYTDIQRNKHQE